MNNILDLMKTPKDVNNDIVKRMRARRKEQKLTQAELSRRAGVSLGSLNRREIYHLTPLLRLLLF